MAAGDPSNSESDASDSGDDAPAESGMDSHQRSGKSRKRVGEGEPANQCANGHPTDPREKDLSKEELKARLQRKRWGSRLGRLIWLFLAAMNLYLAYLIVSMVT